MRYLPHTPDEIQSMLAAIGADSLEELFRSIPKELQLQHDLKLPEALPEQELRIQLQSLANKNKSADQQASFLGGGAYYHYVPSPISQLINRGEFFTAYTPYQPEVSQGTLQALFEYQTMLCELTGMEVANASNYDASTGCAEALLMAHRINGKKKALIPASLNPQYKQVIHAYLDRFGYELMEVGFNQDGTLDQNDLSEKLSEQVGAVLVQSPNYFGVIENLKTVGQQIQASGALFITVASEALASAIVTPPGHANADIAVMEAQSFGVGLNYGGPYLGVFATQQKYIRNMPGRVVGETLDAAGKRGYVLTFSTREQHIRREKATSNICTNQGLCALMATIYLSLLGKQGLVNLAKLNLSRATYAKRQLVNQAGVELQFSGPSFNEFVIKLPNAKEKLAKLASEGIQAGILLTKYFPEFTDSVLVCVTEMNSKAQIDELVEKLS